MVGIEPSLSSLFNEAVIERHIEVAMENDPPSARRTRRANLRFIARALKMPLFPEPSPIGRKGPAAPYSPGEIEAYFTFARSQITARRRNIEAMLCLGLGAGLDGVDMRYVTGRHVFSRSGGLVVVVEGAGLASCPCFTRYQELLCSCAEFSGGSYMVGGFAPTRKNVTTPVLARASGGIGLKRLSVSRLRSTWIAEHLEHLGLHGLLYAAGLKYSQRLFDLAGHVPSMSEPELVACSGDLMSSRLSRLESVLKDSGVAAMLEAAIPTAGPSRQLRAHAVLVGILLSISTAKVAHLASSYRALCDLPVPDQIRLGVARHSRNGLKIATYRQFEHSFSLK